MLRQLGATALFAAKFRECAARALLLPRRRPGQRTPLWQQRKRAYDLLQVASRYGSFPMLLEAYRECLRDQFDMPALVDVLRGIAQRSVRVVDGRRDDALAVRRVAALRLRRQLPLRRRRAARRAPRPGADDRPGAAARTARRGRAARAARRGRRRRGRARTAGARRPGREEPRQPARPAAAARRPVGSARWRRAAPTGAVARLGRRRWCADRRAVWLPVAGETRLVAVEDAARFRDALGVPLPPGLPEALLEPVADPLGDLASRYARTHAPFTVADLAVAIRPRRGAGRARRCTGWPRRDVCSKASSAPVGTHREWCDPGVLATIRRRSLAKLRQADRAGRAARARAIRHRVARRYRTAPRARRAARRHRATAGRAACRVRAGARDPAGPRRGLPPGGPRHAGRGRRGGVGRASSRSATATAALRCSSPTTCRACWPPPAAEEPADGRERAILDELRRSGATFFAPLHDAAGGGYPQDTVDALWNLVWRGLITNDSLHALRAFVTHTRASRRRAGRQAPAFRSRRTAPPFGPRALGARAGSARGPRTSRSTGPHSRSNCWRDTGSSRARSSRLRASPAGSRVSTTSTSAWRNAAGCGAATSRWAWARRSSPSRRRSTCCVRCARAAPIRTRMRSCRWRPPIQRTRTAAS